MCLAVTEKEFLKRRFVHLQVNAWYMETGVPAFQILSEPLDEWLCAAVFMPRLVVVTVSEKGTLCLWDSISGHLHSKQELLGLEEEVPTCSMLLQKLGRMIAGFSQGSLLMVFVFPLCREYGLSHGDLWLSVQALVFV